MHQASPRNPYAHLAVMPAGKQTFPDWSAAGNQISGLCTGFPDFPDWWGDSGLQEFEGFGLCHGHFKTPTRTATPRTGYGLVPDYSDWFGTIR